MGVVLLHLVGMMRVKQRILLMIEIPLDLMVIQAGEAQKSLGRIALVKICMKCAELNFHCLLAVFLKEKRVLMMCLWRLVTWGTKVEELSKVSPRIFICVTSFIAPI